MSSSSLCLTRGYEFCVVGGCVEVLRIAAQHPALVVRYVVEELVLDPDLEACCDQLVAFDLYARCLESACRSGQVEPRFKSCIWLSGRLPSIDGRLLCR